jgi:hypothetical protein
MIGPLVAVIGLAYTVAGWWRTSWSAPPSGTRRSRSPTTPAQADPRRDTVMTAPFLRASLFTSVVAFGVAALVAVLALVLVAMGWSLRRVGRSLAA